MTVLIRGLRGRDAGVARPASELFAVKAQCGKLWYLHPRRLLLVAWLLCMGCCPWPAVAAQAGQVSRAEVFSAADSLAAASEATGEAVDGLVWAQRLSTAADMSGDSFAEVVAESLRQHGLSADWAKDRREADLQALAGQALLCVRPALDATEATHWIFLEAIDGSSAMVSSTRAVSVRIALADLTPLWDGRAVWFAKDEQSLDQISESFRPRGDWAILSLMAASAMAVNGMLFASGRRGWPRGVGGQAGALAVCCVSGAVWLGWGQGQAIGGEGLAGGVDRVIVDFRGTDLIVEPAGVESVSEAELRGWAARGEVVWVDARTADEFARGRISGAILVDQFDTATVRLRLAGLAPDVRIVVYCVNEKCGRARAAAAALRRAGYSEVFDYPAGWQELNHWTELEIARDDAK